MFSQAVGLILLATALPLTGAVSDANCTDPTQTWVYNLPGQSPCQVAEKLAAVCIPSGLTLPLLEEPYSVYYGPTSDQNNICQCNEAFYSLVSACAACQDRGWINFDLFVQNCSQVWSAAGISPGMYGILVPSYAFLDVVPSNTFNKTAAMIAATASSETPSGSVIPKPIIHSNSSPKGALIGGVIGGVALIAVAGVLVWMFRRRRRPITLPPSRFSRHYIQLSDSKIDWTTAPKPVYQPNKLDPDAFDVLPYKA